MPRKPSVFVFCALACEAKPLINTWQLPGLPSADHPFAIYADKDKVVVVTGIGKINMAGAVCYTLALFNNPPSPILINVGIAGHSKAAIGTLCLGHKIIDKESGRCFYPQMPFSISCTSYSVWTNSQPDNSYKNDVLYEMEAAGFYEMAVKFSSGELIQVVKIVSDTAQSSIAKISDAIVEEWFYRQLPAIEQIITRLIALRQITQMDENPLYQDLINSFHFTVSRSLKLKSLLQRWQLLKCDEVLTWRKAKARNAKELLIWIEQQLDDTDFYL